MATKRPTKKTAKKALHHRIKTFNFFIVFAALLGMMAGVLMVKMFYTGEKLITINTSAPSDCRSHEKTTYCLKDFLGLSESDATKKAKTLSLASRVVQRDDEQYAVTEDYSEDRLNFTIRSGKVVRVTAG